MFSADVFHGPLYLLLRCDEIAATCAGRKRKKWTAGAVEAFVHLEKHASAVLSAQEDGLSPQDQKGGQHGVNQ